MGRIGYISEIENEIDCTKELVEAPVYEGKSLKDIWDKVNISRIEGHNLDS